MKSLVIIVGCIAAVFCAGVLGHPLDPRTALKSKIIHLRQLAEDGNPENDFFEMANLYHLIDDGTWSERRLGPRENYLLNLDGLIDLSDPHTSSMISYALSSSALQRNDKLEALVEKWKKDYENHEHSGSEYDFVEFIVRHLASEIQSPGTINQDTLMDTIFENNGICSIFNYPAENDISSDAKLAKIIYLLRKLEQRTRKLFGESYRRNENMQLLELASLCDEIKDQGKEIYERVLEIVDSSGSRQASISDTGEPQVPDDACTMLAHSGFDNLGNQFGNRNFLSVLANECLDDLSEQFSRTLAEKKYDASVIYRWLVRLGKYVEQNDGDDAFANAGGYLQRLVDEVPVPGAKLAFEQGAGICSVLDEVEFDRIWRSFESVINLRDVFEKKNESSRESKVDINNLTQLKHFRTVCLLRRSLNTQQMRGAKRRRVEGQ